MPPMGQQRTLKIQRHFSALPAMTIGRMDFSIAIAITGISAGQPAAGTVAAYHMIQIGSASWAYHHFIHF